MSLIALAADKGSPGVTTVAVALGAVWPRPAVVAECDPSAGDLALRLRGPDDAALVTSLGLVSYAAAIRRGVASLREHTQKVQGGLDVLVGLQTAEQASGLTGLWSGIAGGLALEQGVDVLADCGRIGPGSPALDVLRRADLVLLLTRPSLDAVVHLRDRLSVLLPELVPEGRSADVGVLVLAPLGHDSAAAEVSAVLQQSDIAVPVLGRIVVDPDGAAGLRGEPVKRLDRTWIVRSAREVALLLDARLAARRAA